MYALIIIFTTQTTPLQIAQISGYMSYAKPINYEAPNVSRQEYYSLSSCDQAMLIANKKDSGNTPRKIESIVCLMAGY
jgi:hypothetical protein